MLVSRALYIQILIQSSSITALFYDYALTFLDEVEAIWNRRFTASSVLYLGCRLSLLANLIYLPGLLGVLKPHTTGVVAGFIGVVVRACLLSAWTLRAWAIWNKNIWILVVFIPWSVATVLLDIIESTPLDTRSVTVALTLSNLLLEFGVAGVSIFHLFRRKRHERDAFRKSLSERLLEEGVLYIIAVTGINLASVIVGAFTPQSSFYQHLLSAYVLPLSGLLTARFILDIRLFDINSSTVSNDSSGIKFKGRDRGQASTVDSTVILSEDNV